MPHQSLAGFAIMSVLLAEFTQTQAIGRIKRGGDVELINISASAGMTWGEGRGGKAGVEEGEEGGRGDV